jgi:hypothetical protein
LWESGVSLMVAQYSNGIEPENGHAVAISREADPISS